MSKLTINLGGWPIFITILLCVLKLTGVLTISWWWCFCMFWLPFAIIFALIGFCVLALLLVVIFALISELINILKE